MAEKKVKIDLKSRLGRASSQPSGQPALPGSSPGAIPPPTGIVPPPGIMTPSGIPAPPFAAPKPKVDTSDPFAAQEAAAARPADIRVEIGTEVVQAERKSRVMIFVAAAITLVVGGGLGFVWGGMHEKSKVDKVAVANAQELTVDIEKSNKEIKAIGEKIDAAYQSLFKDKKFPENFSKELAGMGIGFDATAISGRNISRFKPMTTKNLVEYTSSVQELVKRKERLARMFDANKNDIIALLEQGTNPKISYVVFVGKDEKRGAAGTFAKIKQPFEFNKDWPEKVGIVASAQETVEAERYKSGEPFTKPPRAAGGKPSVFAIPIEPDGVAKVFPNDVSKRVESELTSTSVIINGTPTGTTTADDERAGLLKLGEDIIKDLREIGKKR